MHQIFKLIKKPQAQNFKLIKGFCHEKTHPGSNTEIERRASFCQCINFSVQVAIDVRERDTNESRGDVVDISDDSMDFPNLQIFGDYLNEHLIVGGHFEPWDLKIRCLDEG